MFDLFVMIVVGLLGVVWIRRKLRMRMVSSMMVVLISCLVMWVMIFIGKFFVRIEEF